MAGAAEEVEEESAFGEGGNIWNKVLPQNLSRVAIEAIELLVRMCGMGGWQVGGCVGGGSSENTCIHVQCMYMYIHVYVCIVYIHTCICMYSVCTCK